MNTLLAILGTIFAVIFTIGFMFAAECWWTWRNKFHAWMTIGSAVLSATFLTILNIIS